MAIIHPHIPDPTSCPYCGATKTCVIYLHASAAGAATSLPLFSPYTHDSRHRRASLATADEAMHRKDRAHILREEQRRLAVRPRGARP